MNIIYFAGGNNVNVLLSVYETLGINITRICIAFIEPNLEKYKNFALEKKIPIAVYKKDNIEELFKKTNEELLLSVGYRYIIPIAIFTKFKYAVNIHPTLLPKYKGAYSGYAIIENGEEETGITAHLIDEGIDTGDVIEQINIPLTKFDTTKTMSEKVSKLEPIFVSNVLKNILKGNMNTKKQLSNSNIIYSEKRKPEDSRIDETKPLIELYNKIKACDQERFPAYFELDGKKVKIKLEFEDENK